MRALAFVLLMAAPALADAPVTSERPVARAGTDARTPPALVSVARPVARPGAPALARPSAQPAAPAVARPAPQAQPPRSAMNAPRRALRRGPDAEMDSVLTPVIRPESISAAQARRLRGSVCGDPALLGEIVGRVPGRIAGCGIADAVRIKSVSGVGLSQAALMDCNTARALKTWTESSAKPALRRMGGGLEGIRVAAHYACRTRNNQPGAKLSEHGKGRAIDISAFRLQDGNVITVLDGWNQRRAGAALRKMHSGACGPFGTVLGPEANRFHRDHFHFDTARYRSGSYCR